MDRAMDNGNAVLQSGLKVRRLARPDMMVCDLNKASATPKQLLPGSI